MTDNVYVPQSAVMLDGVPLFNASIAYTFTSQATFAATTKAPILITAEAQPTGSASQVNYGINIPANTIAFQTTNQTGPVYALNFGAVTLTNPSSATISNAGYINFANPMIAGSNVTITNIVGLNSVMGSGNISFVAQGRSGFGGSVVPSGLDANATLTLKTNTAPTGSASAYFSHGVVSTATIAFATTPQTGDYITWNFQNQTLTNPSSGTIGNGATIKIGNAPIASTNVTITNAYALWVASGLTQIAAFGQNITTKGSAASPYTIGANDSVLVITTGGAANFTLNLPAATGSGRIIIVTKADAAAKNVVITPNGADTIEGAATLSLTAQYKKSYLIDGASALWYDLSASLV